MFLQKVIRNVSSGHIFKDKLKSSYDDVISAVDDVFTNGIKILQK